MTPYFPDLQHVDEIRRSLWTDRALSRASVMVGAGMSRNAEPAHAGRTTMTTWSELISVMIDRLYPAGTSVERRRKELSDQAGATSTALRLAEEFSAAFGRSALDDLIVQSIPDAEFLPSSLHTLLLELPWSDVLTTNYDTLLERAAASALGQRYSVIRSPEEIATASRPRIVKLHGSFPSSRPFILTEEDFRTYPRRFAPFVNLAQQVAMENVLCLIGFSGDDPNFLYWTGWVRDHLGPYSPKIYLCGLLNLSDSERLLLHRRNVTPIDFTPLFSREEYSGSFRHYAALEWFLLSLRNGRPYNVLEWPDPPPTDGQSMQKLPSPLPPPAGNVPHRERPHPSWH